MSDFLTDAVARAAFPAHDRMAKHADEYARKGGQTYRTRIVVEDQLRSETGEAVEHEVQRAMWERGA